MWGWGCQRKIAQPRQGPPTSPALLYKRERWSAARQWLLQTHKEVLAPQETLQVRIATTSTFVAVDYPHCQVRTILFSSLNSNKRCMGGGEEVKIYWTWTVFKSLESCCRALHCLLASAAFYDVRSRTSWFCVWSGKMSYQGIRFYSAKHLLEFGNDVSDSL